MFKALELWGVEGNSVGGMQCLDGVFMSGEFVSPKRSHADLHFGVVWLSSCSRCWISYRALLSFLDV